MNASYIYYLYRVVVPDIGRTLWSLRISAVKRESASDIRYNSAVSMCERYAWKLLKVSISSMRRCIAV